VVTYSSAMPSPPNAMLVGRATGTGTTASSSPDGANRRSAPPSHIATQTYPSRSTVRPSGMPATPLRSANTRLPRASPASGS
jgi:hypothetical protein